MDEQKFRSCIEMIRSDDAETYEQGFWSLIYDVPQFKDEIIQLMQAEKNPKVRAKFVELLGDAKDPKIIPLLVAELEHPDIDVRYWAVLSLEYSGLPEAKEIAERYKAEHPEQWA